MRRYLPALFIALLLTGVAPVAAQEGTPTPGPVYVVQEGDTLWTIALRFDVSIDALMAANGLAGNDIFVGDRLVIPGYEGLSGTLLSQAVPYGETLRSIVRRYRIDEAFLRRLNHIVSPTELYAGANLILLQRESQPAWSARTNLTAGETPLELAARTGNNPWTLSDINHLAHPWISLPGDVLYLPSGSSEASATGLPAALASVTVTPLPIPQGGTAQIRVTTTQAVTLGGMLVDRPLRFFAADDGSLIAIQGVHAMLEPGLHPLRLEVADSAGEAHTFEQMILIVSGYYPEDPALIVPPSTIDPAVTGPELEQVIAITAAATPVRYWNGVFFSPASQYAESTFFTSRYGNRRTYYGEGTELTVESFHTGLDFGGGTGLPITAPAAGMVVFAGPLTVRGNATIIDHGWGVYSGFWHQSEIKVEVGQRVESGQVIGLVGGTGRVTGAHLHWELWVNGIQVDPLPWLEDPFPR